MKKFCDEILSCHKSLIYFLPHIRHESAFYMCCPRSTIIPGKFQRPEGNLTRNVRLHWLGLLAPPILFLLNKLPFLVMEIREIDRFCLFLEKKPNYILISASGPIIHSNFSRCFPTEQTEIIPLLCVFRLQSSHLYIV